MDFISLHERVTEDNNLFNFLLDIFPYETRKMKRTEEYILSEDDLVLVTNGIVAKKTNYRNAEKGLYNILMCGSIFWLTGQEKNIILENEHNVELAILSKTRVFEKLDQDGLLSHLLLEQLAQQQEEHQFQSNLVVNRKARIAEIILHLAMLNKKLYGFNDLIIPYNVRFTKLAAYGYCSRSLVAKTIKELEALYVIKKVDRKKRIFNLKAFNSLIKEEE